MTMSESDAARVMAAKEVMARAEKERLAKAGATAGGKKAERQASAEKVAQSGRFAPPSAPKLVVDNKR